MATLANLTVGLIARTAQFQRGMKRARGIVRRFSGTIRTFGRGLVIVTRRILAWGAALAAIATGGGLFLMIRQSLKSLDALGKLSTKLGESTENLARLRHAGELTGIEFRTMAMAIQRMTRRLAEAKAGTGEARDTIRELGLDAKKLSAAGPYQAFLAIAKAMKGVTEQGDRVRMSFKLFDSEGVALVNTLALGRKGLEDAAAQADKFGRSLSTIQVRQVERANDAILRAKSAMAGLAEAITTQLAPAIGDAADRTANLTAGIIDTGRSGFDALELLTKGVTGLNTALDHVRGAVLWLRGSMLELLVHDIIGPLAQIQWMAERIMQVVQPVTYLKLEATSPRNFIALYDGMIDTLADLEKQMKSLQASTKRADIAAYFAKLREDWNKTFAPTGADGASPLEMMSQTATAIEVLLTFLRKQRDTFGMTAKQIALYNLALLKATPAQMKLAATLAGTHAELVRAADAMQKLEAQATRVFEETRTPIERFWSTFDKLGTLLGKQLITWNTYARAIENAKEQLLGTAKAAERISGTPAVTAGTAAAFTAVRQHRFGGIGTETVPQDIRATLAEARAQTELLRAQLAATRELAIPTMEAV